MESARSSQTLINIFEATWRYIPEECNNHHEVYTMLEYTLTPWGSNWTQRVCEVPLPWFKSTAIALSVLPSWLPGPKSRSRQREILPLLHQLNVN
jgi:hypothetical protein